MKPTVTIGMCVRDGEKLIGYALEKVARQDFPHEKMQMIIVDDGSKDRTLQIVKESTSKTDIDVKIFQTNWQGLGPARNLILNNADGKYIIWVDSDELLPSSYVRKQVEFMEKNPEVGITTGIAKTVPGNLVLNLELVPGIVTHLTYERPLSFIWKTRKIPGTGGATFRLIALKQVNGFDDRLKGVGEDQDVAQRIRKAGWLIRVNRSGFYELHGGLSTVKDLWRKYVWYGTGSEKLYRQNRELFSLPRMSPIGGFLAGVFYSIDAYKYLRQKQGFLLPIHYGLKMTAWTYGFIRGQIRSIE